MNSEQGHIALILVVLTSAVLITSLSLTAYLAITHRLAIALTEEKIQNRYTAETCAYQALVNLAYDKSYKGDEVIAQKYGNCKIEPISQNDNVITIKTKGSLNNLQNSTVLTIDPVTLSVTSWQTD